ncbi:MAG: 30S ribosomal protein S19e [Aeropyrum sp.]|nr:30S ribosomal protein S19e [Aeropyrum sp.]MCE4616055.1 30S ribosomal protein S19e [Aeropyrum sp.]
MVTALEVPADMLIRRVAAKLKEKYPQVKPPVWAYFAKTGPHKERPPVDRDWWYIRAASILRKLYKSPEPVGVEAFRVIYGGRQNRGSAPEHFRKAGGSVPRNILQQLEEAGLVVKIPGKGRTLSPAGRSLLDTTAKEILQELAKERPELERYL